MPETTATMSRTEARKTARLLERADHFGITIAEEFPEGTITVRSFNRAAVARTYRSFAEAEQDTEARS